MERCFLKDQKKKDSHGTKEKQKQLKTMSFGNETYTNYNFINNFINYTCNYFGYSI